MVVLLRVSGIGGYGGGGLGYAFGAFSGWRRKKNENESNQCRSFLSAQKFWDEKKICLKLKAEI